MAAMREELPGRKTAKPESTLRDEAKWWPGPRDFIGALRKPGVGVIAEVKRGSPSKGEFAPNLDPLRTARMYRAAGAVAVSVLTSRHFFAADEDLHLIAESLNDDERANAIHVCPPLLRKEFHFDPYQVLEARALGADAYLLIVKTMGASALRDCIQAGADLGITAFVEVTNEAEMETALHVEAPTIGINNRDLHTFHEDLGTTERLRALAPPEIPVVAASGVRTFRGMQRMKDAKVDAVLVGEALSTVDDPRSKMRELMGETV